jgi:hypothetical protein
MKTEVYSWRLDAEKKLALEAEARREGKSVAEVLDEISSEWLNMRRDAHDGDGAEQARIRKRIMVTVGTVRGGDPTRATRSRELVREIVRRKHEKESSASRRTH